MVMINDKRKRKNRQKWQVGDYFLVPLLNGEFVLGQAIAEVEDLSCFGTTICVFFNVKVNTEQEAQQLLGTLTDDKEITAMVVTWHSLDWGDWKVFDHGLASPPTNYFNISRIGSEIGINSSGIANEFLDAFYRLRPWDRYYDPAYLDELLVFPERKPSKVFTKAELKQKWSEGDYFLVKLVDGRFSVGQVIKQWEWDPRDPYRRGALCTFFGISVADRAEGLRVIGNLSDDDVISVLIVTVESLDWGVWEVVQSGKAAPVKDYVGTEDVNEKTFYHLLVDAYIVPNFLNAYHGLKPWDMCHQRDYFDNLLSIDKKPDNLIYINPPATKRRVRKK